MLRTCKDSGRGSMAKDRIGLKRQKLITYNICASYNGATDPKACAKAVDEITVKAVLDACRTQVLSV